MEALKFSQLEYMGAFSFASGLAVLFVTLYVTSMRARLSEIKKASLEIGKEATQREEKSIEMQVKLLETISEQTRVISRFMQLEETVTDLSRRVIKLEP